MATEWIWDEAALDGRLANSQAFARDSTMWLKVGQPARARIIAYLKKYAPYKGR